MSLYRAANGLGLLVFLAACGAFLVYVPPQLIAQYKSALDLGPAWGYAYLAVVGTGGLLLFGASAAILWRLIQANRNKKHQARQAAANPSQLSADQQREELHRNLATANDLQQAANIHAEVQHEITPIIEKISAKEEHARLEIVAFGTVSSGKSSLLNALAGRDVFVTDPRGGTTTQRNEIAWPGASRVSLVDTPGLGEVEGAERVALAATAARDADLVLLVVDSPLRNSEHQLLAQLGAMEKRVLICLNKNDWYAPRDRDLLLAQLAEQAAPWVKPQHILAVSSQPHLRQRTRVLPDGSLVEESLTEPGNIAPLAEQLLATVASEGERLLLANLLLQSRGLVEETRQKISLALDRRAWNIVDNYMWGAGGAAALSPLPLVDLVAGIGISSKMVVDLAAVYRQTLDLDAALKLLSQLGKNLVGILGAQAGAPVVGAVVGSLLKTIPGVGTIAGGLLQGVVQALLTRWIGAVFIEYFRNQMREPTGGLAALARREWSRLTTADELRKLVAAAKTHWRGDNAP